MTKREAQNDLLSAMQVIRDFVEQNNPVYSICEATLSQCCVGLFAPIKEGIPRYIVNQANGRDWVLIMDGRHFAIVNRYYISSSGSRRGDTVKVELGKNYGKKGKHVNESCTFEIGKYWR